MNEQEILETGTRIGVTLHNERVKSSQVNKLLEIFESEKDARMAISILSIYIAKQEKRGYLKRGSATEIINTLSKTLSNKRVSKDEVRKILGISKWVYEALGEDKGRPVTVRDVKSLLEELLKDLRRGK